MLEKFSSFLSFLGYGNTYFFLNKRCMGIIISCQLAEPINRPPCLKCAVNCMSCLQFFFLCPVYFCIREKIVQRETGGNVKKSVVWYPCIWRHVLINKFPIFMLTDAIC